MPEGSIAVRPFTFTLPSLTGNRNVMGSPGPRHFCSLYASNVFLLLPILLFVGKKPQFPISSVLVSVLLSLMSPA